MALTLFEIIDRLTVEKRPIDFTNDEEAKSYDAFAVDRALSMCDILVPIVSDVVLMNLPKKAHMMYYMDVLPKRKLWIDWIKMDKDINKETKEYIMDYYNCSEKKAVEYLELLNDDQIEEILKNYKYGVGKVASV